MCCWVAAYRQLMRYKTVSYSITRRMHWSDWESRYCCSEMVINMFSHGMTALPAPEYPDPCIVSPSFGGGYMVIPNTGFQYPSGFPVAKLDLTPVVSFFLVVQSKIVSSRSVIGSNHVTGEQRSRYQSINRAFRNSGHKYNAHHGAEFETHMTWRGRDNTVVPFSIPPLYSPENGVGRNDSTTAC